MQLLIPQMKVKLICLGKSVGISKHMDGYTYIVGRSHTVASVPRMSVRLGLETAHFHRILNLKLLFLKNTLGGRVKMIVKTVKGKHYNILG